MFDRLLIMQYFPFFGQRLVKKPLVTLLVTVGLCLGVSRSSIAETADSAPVEVKTLISQVDSFANRKDIQGVMGLYSQRFYNSDGVNNPLLNRSLEQLWKTYPDLTYTTTLESWERQGNQVAVTTVTSIQGTQNQEGRIITLKSTLRSRQWLENQQIVRQDILAEKTELTSGIRPPEVQVMLPETVKIGQRFSFDVMVVEPLGDEVLLGTALEEKTSANGYLRPVTPELELLPSGGLYKWVTAPRFPGSHWLSAIVIRKDGITQITQRVRVER